MASLPGRRLEGLLFEHLRDQTHVLVDDQPRAVGDGYAGRLLPPVLQREQSEEGETGDIHLGGVDGEHPTFIMG